MKIEFKGFKNPRPEDHEKKEFNSTTANFSESKQERKGFEGRQFTLVNEHGELVGNLLLTRDDPNDTWVKIRVFGVEKPYMGSGAVNFMYDKSFEIAREDGKDLVMDCVATIGAYKSFIKYLKEHSIKFEENPLNQYQEDLKTYKAPERSWTIRIKQEYF